MPKVDPVQLALALDRAGGRRYPLGQQLVDELRRRVQAGSLGQASDCRPSGLGGSLGVTPETVAAAYKRLTRGLSAGRGRTRHVRRGAATAAEEDPLAPFEAGGALPPFRRSAPAPGPRDLLRLASQPGVVSFAASVAAPDLAPVEALREALSDVLRRKARRAPGGRHGRLSTCGSHCRRCSSERGMDVDPVWCV